jgi:putative salt-induced outer membrane protein
MKKPAAAILLGSIAAWAVGAGQAFAQEEDDSGWSGEGSFGAGVTTGNTETSDYNAGVKLAHKGSQWAQSGEFAAEYGETEKVETKNRLRAAGQVDRFFGERASTYGRLTWERDEFSGFENRYFFGLGAAYKVVVSENTAWTLQGGPGYRIDEVRESSTSDEPPVVTPASTEESFGAALGSRFKHSFNPYVELTDDTDVTYSQTSTRITNSLALNFKLVDGLSARLSYDVNHDTDPVEGFEATDTATRFSVVYKLD